MPERLTECMVERGCLSPEAAEEALERQVLMGGALDTALFELSLAQEPDVVAAMSEAYGLEVAQNGDVTGAADPRALRAFPERWALKHRLAPLSLEDDTLSVLSPAPADVRLVLRLGELIETTVRPVLAPEFRVEERLSLLYGVKPPERYRALIGAFGGRTSVLEGPVRSADNVDFASALARLQRAESRDNIGRTALQFLGRDLEVSTLFIVHDGALDGWMARGDDVVGLQNIRIPLERRSALGTVVDTKTHYLGPLAKTPEHQDFLQAVGRPHPRSVLIAPIILKERTVALLYCENGSREIGPARATEASNFIPHVQNAMLLLLQRRKTTSFSQLPRSESAASMVPLEVLPAPGAPTLSDVPLAQETLIAPMFETSSIEDAADSLESALSSEEAGALLEDTPSPLDPDPLETPLPAPVEAPPPALVETPPPAPTDKTTSQPVAETNIAGSQDEFSIPPATTEDTAWKDMLTEPEFDLEGQESEAQVVLRELSNLPEPTLGEQDQALASPETSPTQGSWSASEEEITSPGEPLPLDSEIEDAWDDVSLTPTGSELEITPEALSRSIGLGDSEPERSEPSTTQLFRLEPSTSEEMAEVEVMESPPQEADPPWADGESDWDLPIEGPDMKRDAWERAALATPHPIHSVPEEVRQHAQKAPDKATWGTLEEKQVAEDEANLDLEQQVARRIGQLESSNELIRGSAKEALLSMGVEALPYLALYFPGPTFVDPFAEEVAVPDFRDCGALLDVLADYQRDASEVIENFLEAPDPRRRFFATHFYSSVYVPETVPRLIQRLHDEEPRVCMTAARTLFGYRSHPQFGLVLEHLHGRLSASSVAARKHATHLIGLFRDVTAVPKLISMIERREMPLDEAACRALIEITKQNMGLSARRWRSWWGKNSDKNRMEWLIEGLANRDLSIRKSAAEELEAITHLDFGFSPDAPRRARDKARRKWVEWWNQEREPGLMA